MKPDLILHIGLPKTGTTSLQQVLGAHRAALLERGVVYPVSPGTTTHHFLPASIIDIGAYVRHFNPVIWDGMAPPARIERFRREFAEEFANLPQQAERVLISAEHCAGTLNTIEMITALRDLLAPYCGNMRVLVYLRRQDLFEASNYNQGLRIGDLQAKQLPIENAGKLRHLNYLALLDNWAAVFGERAIQVRIFERQALRGGDVIEDFLEACGIDLSVAADDPNRKRNASISQAGQRLMVRIGQRLAEQQGEGALASATFRRVGHVCAEALSGRGWLPTRAEAREFMAAFAASNEAVRRRFRPDLPTLFAEDYDSLPEAPVEPDGDTLLTAAIDGLLFEIQENARRQAIASLKLARLHRQLGDLAATGESLRQAIAFNPSLLPARLALAGDFLRDGDLAAAREHALAAAKIDPEAAPVRNLLRRIEKAERQRKEGVLF